MSLMEYIEKVEMTNKFRWPSPEIDEHFDEADLLLKIDEPIHVTKGKRSSHYLLEDDDYSDATDLLQIVSK